MIYQLLNFRAYVEKKPVFSSISSFYFSIIILLFSHPIFLLFVNGFSKCTGLRHVSRIRREV